jgi:uncharacterized repeat protein (TIGR02543 family)
MKNEKLKMKNVKMTPRTITRFFLLTLFIVHYSLFIFSSCQNPFTGPETGNTHTQIPAGKGSFSLSVTVADVGRTLLPVLKQSDFTKYTLAFTPTNGGTSLSVERIPSTISNPVYLDPGTYSLVVTAYITADPVARGKIDELVIEDGGNTTREITLRVINESGYQGTFKYTVSFPTEGVTAKMKITPLDTTTGTSEQNRDLVSGTPVTLTLNTGYYNVVLTLEKKGAQLVWREILHIYGNLESTFTKNFTNDDFYRTIYTVRFDSNYTGSLPPLEASVVHGGKSGEPDEPERPGYYFNGWYLDMSGTEPFSFDTQIISDTTIYAGWTFIPITSVTLSPTTLILDIGGTSKLSATVLPSNANLSVTWISSNNTVAEVTIDGTVNAKAGGTTTITVTSVADTSKTATCIVTVPLLINEELDLLKVGRNEGNNGWTLSAHYKLTKDITLSGGTNNWTPIGSTTEQFSGSFDGNGFSISSLNISAPNTDYRGMFAVINTSGIVKNLALNCTVSGKDFVGGVTGYNKGTVENCYVTGTVSGADDVGGMVGFNVGTGIVKNCYATCDVSGTGTTGAIGGVVGLNDATVENCFASGVIRGVKVVGGVVGYNDEGKIRNCVGLNGQITRISGNNIDFGRVVGYNDNTLTNTYARNDMTLPGNVNLETTAAGKDGTNITFANWSDQDWWNSSATNRPAFNLSSTGAWEWLSTNYLPILKNLGTQDPKVLCTLTFTSNGGSAVASQTVAAGSIISSPESTRSGYTLGGWYTDNNTFNTQFNFNTQQVTSNITLYAKWNTNTTGGAGTQNDPFRIYNVTDLQRVGRETTTGGWTLSAHYRLEVDINLTGNVWTRIGTPADQDKFKGTFDGNNHSITGLIINASELYQGMFAYLAQGALVNDLTLKECDIRGSSDVGVVAGQNDGTVKNCYVSGIVVPSSSNAGGVVGMNGSSGTVENCSSSVNISGTQSNAGGVVGSNSGVIRNCYATGDVSGSGNVGGVAGWNAGTVQNCYATGNVSGTNNIGGVVGNSSNSSSTVQNCVALNTSLKRISGQDNYYGRVAGVGSSLKNNYGWNGMSDGGTNLTFSMNSLTGWDGEDVTTQQYTTQSWWTTPDNWNGGAWDLTNIWEWDATRNLPKLQGVGGQ